ncbi:hypothetical protein WM2015_753 [Wenzhouxiangella marina]|uniref:RES domain-containing protein n=1 Tax=Wenzhouxiangella marina TaxID=1579979 RepID=A0A0K0XTU4_9GAMM|nr:hypothetical protein WM2015_753 [Wenzhouxiangella marina]
MRLPDGRVWLRVADPDWKDPLDPSWARAQGGRWNPPGSHSTLYLNADPRTCRLQLERLLAGSPVSVDDLDDEAYDLVAVTLPGGQVCADAVTVEGLNALGLSDRYPLDARGNPVPRSRCQPLGQAIQAATLRGVWCRSAASNDGLGRELAWFPARASSLARAVWPVPKSLGVWRHAEDWSALGLLDQAEPG